MTCPFCTTHDTRVLETRDTYAGAIIGRRYECCACANRFTTYERHKAMLDDSTRNRVRQLLRIVRSKITETLRLIRRNS